MPLTADGRELVLENIRDNATQVQLIGLDTSSEDPSPNYASDLKSLDPNNDWTFVSDQTSYSIIVSVTPKTWTINPAPNEIISILAVNVLDSASNLIVSSNVSETFERDGEFTVEEIQVTVE